MINQNKLLGRFRRIRKLMMIIDFLLTQSKIKSGLLNDILIIVNDIIATLNRFKPELNYYDFTKQKFDKQKLFILGSGASVNDLSEKNWQEIKSGSSFSFNYFLVKGFTGNLHFIEYSEIKEEQKIYYEAIQENPSLQQIIYIINQFHYNEKVSPPPAEINDLFYFQNPFRFPSTNKRLIKFLLQYGSYILPIDNPNYGIHHSSSVCYLINLGVRMGFRHIVLVGIDLNNADYFFYERKGRLDKELTKIYKNYWRNSNIHETADPNFTNRYNEMSTPEYIKLYHSVVCRKKSVKLEVANPKSLLASFLNVYKFDNNV